MNRNDFPNYVKLFGNIDFRESDDTRSVYSPSAYMVDLLQIIGDYFNSAPDFEKRRNDIKDIALDSQNTLTLVPYLDIANEVLAHKVAGSTDPEIDAFEILKEAPYPFNLPFNLSQTQIALYERYLGITAEKLHKAFARQYNNNVIAREYLSLGQLDEDILPFVSEFEGEALRTRYGGRLPTLDILTDVLADLRSHYEGHLPDPDTLNELLVDFRSRYRGQPLTVAILTEVLTDFQNRYGGQPPGQNVLKEHLTDFRNRFGGHLPPIDTPTAAMVEQFLMTTDITHAELRLLLQGHLSVQELESDKQTQLFCNFGLNGFASYDYAEEKIVWRTLIGEPIRLPIPEQWFDRAQRLIRLARRTSLSITDIDLIVRDCCRNCLDAESLERIAVVKNVSMLLSLSIDETCALFGRMSDFGHGNKEEPLDLFNRVFNGSIFLLDRVYIGDYSFWLAAVDLFTRLRFTGDILALDNKLYRSRIARGLQMSEKQLQAVIRGFRSRTNEDIEEEEEHNKLWSTAAEEAELLSVLYRVSQLTHVLDVSVDELFMLLDILEQDTAVRQIADSEAFIHYTISERNCYHILRQGSTEQLMWLVQLLYSLVKWLQKYNFSAEMLLKIATGRYGRQLTETADSATVKKMSPAAEARKEKITTLNELYKQLVPWLLNEKSFVSNTFDSRFSRIIYQAIVQSELVSSADSRLLQTNESAIKKVAQEAINRVDVVTKADFLGLGSSEKIADKIFSNLILMGYLSAEGILNEEMLPESSEAFALETDFASVKEALFGLIQTLHIENIDVAIYPSDLQTLDLSPVALSELYNNFIFNGYLSEDGTLLQGPTFESSDNLDLFEVNAQIDEYAVEVFQIISRQVEKFKQSHIHVAKDKLIDLPLSEHELDDLIRNLKFNEYLNDKNELIDQMAMQKLMADELLLELRFYPHRHKILGALHSIIEQQKNQLYLFTRDSFADVADQLVADWVYDALSGSYLEEGRIQEAHRNFFENRENAAALDISWPFEPIHNEVVFNRLRTILQSADQYRLIPTLFEALKFDYMEISELFYLLRENGYLTMYHKLPSKFVPYFLNIDNALTFEIETFEDYSKDIFFMLHDVAKRIDGAVQEIETVYAKLVEGQTQSLYQTLQNAFNLPADSIAAISEQVFSGTTNERDEWLIPILATVNIYNEIDNEPQSGRFNTAFRRIQQFALLANHLKLNRNEIEIALQDQNLVEKYPATIQLPELTHPDNTKYPITKIDALLESRDGHIFLFKSADPSTADDYARYWSYSAATHQLIENEDDKLSTLLAGGKESKVKISRVDAAFVDKHGRDVIIADGHYYVKNHGKNGSVWQIQEREWGLVESDFENLQVVNAAFTDESGRTYLFSNDQYVRYTNGIDFVDDGYPKNTKDSWSDEGKIYILPEPFKTPLDAAFYGTDNKTYFFKDNQFFAAHDPTTVRSTNEVWGKVKNNLKASQSVDAFYYDSAWLYVLSGDQIFAYRDTIENQHVMVYEGFPKSLVDHFGADLPGEFHAGVDAAFKGVDGCIYLFKGEKAVALCQSTVAGQHEHGKTVPIKEHWGVVSNNLVDTGQVDAALAGLDGRVYIFSGDQYFRYSSRDYSEVDSGYPRRVSEDWGGLTAVNAAFILDGKTYLFGTGEIEQDDGSKVSTAAYVCYSSNDYEKPDIGYPKEQAESDEFWLNLPESLRTEHKFSEVDAIFNAPDGKIYLFSGNIFIVSDRLQGWWSEPSPIHEMWQDIPFDAIDAAFYGKDGKTYFFHDGEYVRLSGNSYDQVDNGYPRPTNRLWGNIKNRIQERGEIDAAIVVESREEEQQDDHSFKTVITQHTYLFSHDQFYRYKGNDYTQVEAGYPKSIQQLKEEPRFKNLPITFEKGIEAAVGDHRQIYLLQDGRIHIVSEKLYGTYLGSDTDIFKEITCVLTDRGALYVEKNGRWHHLSSVENKTTGLEEEIPPLFYAVPPEFQSGIDAVLRGRDANTYLFKGDKFFNVGLKRAFSVASSWGRVRNNIQDKQQIDTAFVGRDGKTYLFSDDQFVVYDGQSYIGELVSSRPGDTVAIKPIAAQWAGLTNVHLAYVLGEQTYLFEKPDAQGKFRYVQYDTTDYNEPPALGPIEVDTSFWNIPDEHLAQGWNMFNAILVMDENTLVFIKGSKFLQYNMTGNYWSSPKPLSVLWPGTQLDQTLFDNLDTAFIGAEGTFYFFGDECYVTHRNDGRFSTRVPIADDWAILPNRFARQIDAAFVYQDTYTYLFSGQYYIRYTDSDCRYIDDGYPKLISKDLRQEQGFGNLPPAFETTIGELDSDAAIIRGVVANDRNIYIFMGDNCYVSSSGLTCALDIDILGCQYNHLQDSGRIDAAFVTSDKKTYLFSKDQYVRYSEGPYDFVDDGYPKRIATGLPLDLQINGDSMRFLYGGVDAALSISTSAATDKDVIYLFKGHQFFNSQTGKTNNIQGRWGKSQNNFIMDTDNRPLDGAFVDVTGRLYVFKGNQYIRYMDTEKKYAEIGYPKQLISTFQMPDSFAQQIDGAFTYEGYTYLTKGEHFIRYTGQDYNRLSPFYPEKFSNHWGDWSDYLLNDIYLITRFKNLQDSYSGDHTLVDLLKPERSYANDPYAVLADIFGWEIEEIKWLKRYNAFLPFSGEKERLFNLELIVKMFNTFELCQQMATDVKSVYEKVWQKRYGSTRDLNSAAEALLTLLTLKNSNSPDWKVLVNEVHNKLNLLKRHALVSYAIFIDDGIADARDLYENLLIDIQVGEEGQTSRVKEAISAVQLYLHRYFINLETADLKGTNDDLQKAVLKKQWKWMRNYRVWEANRKVFLYPENYIRPELRDSKTPEFKALEESLLQGELSEANITRAFNQYIDHYIEISRLTIAGGYAYDNPDKEDDKNVILFGRTKSEPHTYYYRTAVFINGESDSVNWQPWQAVNVQIDADRVYPVFALNKIFVFWAKVEIRSNVGSDTKVVLKEKGDTHTPKTDTVNESVLQIYYSYYNLNGQWAPPQKIQYDISSNDTITDFFLEFSGQKEANSINLDHVEVNCHYTTERILKPEVGDDDFVQASEIKKLHDKQVYLKAANPQKNYYIDDRPNLQVYARLISSDSTLDKEMQFKIVPPFNPNPFWPINIMAQTNVVYLESVDRPGYYLTWNYLGEVQLSPPFINPFFNIWSSFILSKGLIGEGYSLRLAVYPDAILHFQEDPNHEMVVRIEHIHNIQNYTAKRQASFHFIANRQDEENTFRFYPETNSAQEISEKISTIPLSGFDLFRNLFPDEDITQIKQPVPLNVPINQQMLPWVCFDYKGGSFLCKPTSGQSERNGKQTKDALAHLPQDFLPISAAFHANGKTYFFSNSQGGRYLIDGENEIQTTAETWGVVNNLIQSDSQVDAALRTVVDNKSYTYLFRGNQYVRYNDERQDKFVDESYPRRLAGNPDQLPDIEGWDHIDAAFHIGTSTIFVRDEQFVISDDKFKQQYEVSDRLWGHWTQQADIRRAFQHGNDFYLYDHKLQKWFKETSENELVEKLNMRYPKPDSDNVFLFEPIETAFAIGRIIYMETSTGRARYEGGSSRPPLKHLNAAEDAKAVFIVDHHIYVLQGTGARRQSTGNHPSIVIWNSLEPELVDTVKIKGAPNRNVDTFMYDGARLYLFSGAEYMIVNELPHKNTKQIKWQKSGDTEPFISSLKVMLPFTKLDAGFNRKNQLFLFASNQYLRFTLTETNGFDFQSAFTSPPKPDEGYPKLLSDGAADLLPDWERIDAAFQDQYGLEHFFAGTQFSTSRAGSENKHWVLTPIKETWGKVINNIQTTGDVDTAFVYNNLVYLISGNQYYVYYIDQLNPPTLTEGYPKRLATNPEGLPTWETDKLSGAFTMGGKVYLFYAGWQQFAEFNPQTHYSWYGRIDTYWLWPRNYRDFDAAYNQDGHLHIILNTNMLSYENPTEELIQLRNATYDIVRLSSITGSQLSQALFAGGIAGLMQPSNQEIDELPKFTIEAGIHGDAVIRANPNKVSHYYLPVDSHLEFQGANGQYYWELFYHAPALIAQALNTAQKFEEAKEWYEYIFDPTEIGSYWKFLPFLAIDLDALSETIERLTQEAEPVVKAAATALTRRLKPFAPAFLGQTALDEAQTADLNNLQKWDKARQKYTSWDEVDTLSIAIEQIAAERDRVVIKEIIQLIKRLPIRYQLMTGNSVSQIEAYLNDPFDPHAIAALRTIAYRRATVMDYIDNLIDWGDMLFRQYTHESINEARMLYILAYDLLGKKPSNLGTKQLSPTYSFAKLRDKGAGAETVSQSSPYDFLFDVSLDNVKETSLTHAGIVHNSVGNPYFNIPENDQILDYWARIEDRLHKIRHSQNIMGITQPLPLFEPPLDPMALVRAVAGGGDISAAVAAIQAAVPHYRFTFMLNKARELVNKLGQFGSELLGTLEKRDAEELSLLQNRQEQVILQMTHAIQEAQLREAQETLNYLQISKAGAEKQQEHYETLLREGMMLEEQLQISLMTVAGTIFSLVPALKIAAAIVQAIPDIKVGSPFSMGATTGGSTIGAALGFLAESGEPIAESLSMFGEASGMRAQYLRSEQDWELQLKMATSEIAQLEHQIEGARWQIRAAEQQLAHAEKEAEHNRSVNTFMREKFTNQQLYQWLASKLSALYFQTYKMAHDLAKSAEMAYRFERGLPESQVAFISGTYWDSLKKGLMAGETLDLDLNQMEKAYFDTHSRAFEITKTVSLLEIDPIAFLNLKTKGVCEFQLTEALFDYDFPGHYRRQIKTIAVKLVAGEGQTVNATLTQLSNKTVMEADAKAVKYLLEPRDSQPLTIRSDWRPQQQIAVSEVDPYSGSSNGLFELYFGDDRYLPFEGTGAVSSWRLELNGKRGSYNLSELADAQIEVKYTAYQGGQSFADAVKGMLKPYPSAVYFDIAQRFPNEFFAFVYNETETMELNITRDMFPNMAGSKITGIYSYFEVKDNGQITLVMNDDNTLTLRHNKLLLTNSLAVGPRGERWVFKAKGRKSDLVNMGLVFAYKANV